MGKIKKKRLADSLPLSSPFLLFSSQSQDSDWQALMHKTACTSRAQLDVYLLLPSFCRRCNKEAVILAAGLQLTLEVCLASFQTDEVNFFKWRTLVAHKGQQNYYNAAFLHHKKNFLFMPKGDIYYDVSTHFFQNGANASYIYRLPPESEGGSDSVMMFCMCLSICLLPMYLINHWIHFNKLYRK